MFGQLRFSPGNLVLARYSTYPIWPAVVQRNQTPEYDRFVDIHPNRAGEDVVAYWVVFCGDAEGGWVSADHMLPYHPDLVDLARIPETDSWYTAQARAVLIASRQYALRVRNTSGRPVVAQQDIIRMLVLLDFYARGDDQADIMAMRDDSAEETEPSSSEHTVPRSKLEPSRVKGEPTLQDELTYHPATHHSTRRRKTNGRQTTRERRVTRRTNGASRGSRNQESEDLREILRRRDLQISRLNREARRLRVSRTSQLRHSLGQRDAEIARLNREARERATHVITRNSRIPTFEQWNRATTAESFRTTAARLQNKYTAFCRGVNSYARALQQMHEARSTLSDAYQSLRSQTQMTENEIIDAEQALLSFGDILQEVRFASASEDTIVIGD